MQLRQCRLLSLLPQPPDLSSSTAIPVFKLCCRCLEQYGTMCTNLFGATASVVVLWGSTAPYHEQSGST